MIFVQANLEVVDNSNAVEVKCLDVLRSKKNVAYSGDLIVAVVTKTRTNIQKFDGGLQNQNESIKVGQVLLALVLHTKVSRVVASGIRIRSDKNSVILLKKNNFELYGSRIFGALAKKAVVKRFSKVVSLSSEAT